MRKFFCLAALFMSVGTAACGAAPVSSESHPSSEEIKAESEKLETSETPASPAVAKGCSNWAACYRVCLRRDPAGTSGCEDWCDYEYPQCELGN